MKLALELFHQLQESITTTQISRKAVVVSGTQDAVNKAGRNNELAYQISKSSKELKRDMETTLCLQTKLVLLVLQELLENYLA